MQHARPFDNHEQGSGDAIELECDSAAFLRGVCP
jgi:hypothetical protein